MLALSDPVMLGLIALLGTVVAAIQAVITLWLRGRMSEDIHAYSVQSATRNAVLQEDLKKNTQLTAETRQQVADLASTPSSPSVVVVSGEAKKAGEPEAGGS